MSAPLADRLRPQTLDDVVGQRHLLAEGKALRRIIDSGQIPNMVFYGPSGVGKTTLATMIAKTTNRKLVKMNGTTASTSDIKDVISNLNTFETMNGVLLYLDEIQYFYVYNAVLSRCTVFEFKSVPKKEIERAVQRGFSIVEQELKQTIQLEDGVAAYIATACGGDVRKAMNAVELCSLSADKTEDGRYVTLELAKELTQRSAMRYDKDGDEHYDLLSAFQKSMRGSDPDAAIYYLARLLSAGDLPSVCRRLMVCACEDVGLAWPQIIPIVKASVDAALQVGLPEARIPLADAVIMVCNAPKSNTAYMAINRAMADVEKGNVGSIPRHLQNKHFDGEDQEVKGQFYIYTQDCPNHWTEQQYLPDTLKDVRYYEFGDNKNEQAFRQYWENIKGKKL